MNDIYKPPKSDLTVDENEIVRPHGFWKVFFWINMAFVPLIILGVFFILDDLEPLDFIDLIIFGFTLVGLYSYAFWKIVLTETFWRIFAIGYPLWFVFYEILGSTLIEMNHYGEPATIDGYILVSLLFFLPLSYALYQLAFRSKQLWRSQ